MGTPPPTGASNAGGVGKKRNSERISLHTLHTGLQCCKPYESRSVKNKAATDGVEPSTHGGVRRRCSQFAPRRRRSVCDGLDIIRRRRRSNPPDTTPMVITPFSAVVGHCRTEPGGYFCWKLTLTGTPDPIRPTRWGPYPNRSTNGKKTRGIMT